MNNYKELKIWSKGMEIVNTIYLLAKQLPDEERYTLKSQMIRAAISIPSNIAEGTSRKSQKDFARFIEISLGSCFELETQTMIAKRNYSEIEFNFNDLLQELEQEQKMLNSFRQKLVQKKELETSN